jgi:hypothetical protein
LQIIEEALAETRVCDEVVLGRHDGLAAEGVFHGIEPRGSFALWSFRARRTAGIFAIDRGAIGDRWIGVTHAGLIVKHGGCGDGCYFLDVVEREGRTSRKIIVTVNRPIFGIAFQPGDLLFFQADLLLGSHGLRGAIAVSRSRQDRSI